jgi:hypothetical protein
MDERMLDSLGTVIQQRKDLEKFSGGEVFCWWGVIIPLGILVQWLFGDEPWMYYAMNGFGFLGQTAHVVYMKRQHATNSYWDKQLSSFWLLVVLLIVNIPFLYAGRSGILGMNASIPVNYMLLGGGLYLSGIFKNRYTLRIGGIIMIVSAIVLAAPRFVVPGTGNVVLSMAAMFFGFGVFGLLSNFEKPR